MSEETKDTSPVSQGDDGTIKVDFSATPQEAPAEEPVEQPVEEAPVEEPVVEEAPVEAPVTEEAPEEPVLMEITDEEVEEATEQLEEEVAEAIQESAKAGASLPENIQKVVDFMDETGGSLEDYVRLNTDYSSLNEDQLLREYYETKFSAYDREDIDFLLADKFSYDEDVDDEREIRLKKLERKQALSEAKNHLDGLKSKYYDEIKMGSRLNPEQQKAVEFFNRYNKESEEAAKVAERQTSRFKQESEKVFSDKFEGFDYSVGDKKYRFKVKDAGQVKETQGDINNFIKKFLNENNQIEDAAGYHKSMFTANNADAIAKHFYEQGKADALKESVAKAKNVSMDPRKSFSNDNTSGTKFRVLSDDSTGFKFKIKNKNK